MRAKITHARRRVSKVLPPGISARAMRGTGQPPGRSLVFFQHRSLRPSGSSRSMCATRPRTRFGRMGREAAFFDLDRTLLRDASGPVISDALKQVGLMSERTIPGEALVYRLF